ncbi:MAG: hypothetical protein K1X89_02060 [Myxococcaceae bacterium]|nr:hypothetical protein [Myxococcaceae bacterium]
MDEHVPGGQRHTGGAVKQRRAAPLAPNAPIAAAKVNPVRQRFPVPYGLFVVLALYGLLVLGYLYLAVWSQPEYQAAMHYQAALELLGKDDGRTCPPAQLEKAFTEVLEAARLVPEQKWLHERTETLRGRFADRHLKLSYDLTMRAESQASRYQAWAQREQPWLVVGVREKGWAVDQLTAQPQRIAIFSLPGFGLILAAWGWMRFKARQVAQAEREAQLRAQEAEVEALGRARDAARGRR